MQQFQDEIEVWIGSKLVTVVPKVAEQWIRKEYYGRPEEKKLIIKSRVHVSEEEKNKIVSDLKTELNKKLTT